MVRACSRLRPAACGSEKRESANIWSPIPILCMPVALRKKRQYLGIRNRRVMTHEPSLRGFDQKPRRIQIRRLIKKLVAHRTRVVVTAAHLSAGASGG